MEKNLSMINNESEIISLTDILLIIAKRIKLIIAVPFIFCVISIIKVTFFTSSVYVSSCKIKSSTNNDQTSPVAGIAAQFGYNLSAPSNQKWVYPEILKSRTMARKMLKQRFDSNEFGSQKTLLQLLTYGNEEPMYGKDTLEILAIDIFLTMVNIDENLKTGVYTLSVGSTEPILSMNILNTQILLLDEHQRQYNASLNSKTHKFINNRIIETRKELNFAEDALREFRDHNRRIENSPGLLLEEERLSREVSVQTGVFTTLKQQLEKTKIDQVKENEYVVVIDPPEIPLYRSSPKKKRTVIISGILGTGLGIMIAFFLDFLTRRKKTESDKLKEIKIELIKNIKQLLSIK